MEWIAVKDYEQMSQVSAWSFFKRISAACRSGRGFRMGLATGNTMIRLYEVLAGLLNANNVPLDKLVTYNLDEYIGADGKNVPHDHPLSYYSYMWQNLFGRLDPKLGFKPENARFPDPQDPEGYDEDIRKNGGLDLQLLGIGFNGHIAFNEPIPESEISAAEFAALPTRVVDLKEMTIKTNARLTAGNQRQVVPLQAVSMGMVPILEARECWLNACFPEQEIPLSKMKQNPVATPELPASFLLNHKKFTLVYTSDCIKL